jgi:outer membrane biosynthesis protein TonB
MTPARALVVAVTLIGCKPLPSAMSQMPPSDPAPADSAAAPAPTDATGAPPALGLAPLQPAPEPSTAPAPEPAASTPPGPVEPGIQKTGAPTRGSLPASVVEAKLKSANADFRACYERALKLKPDLRGTVHVAFVVGTSGKVEHAEASDADDTIDDASVVSCALDVVRKLDFPPPKGGPAFVNYVVVLAGG